MSNLLIVQKEDVKGGIQKAPTGKPGSANITADRNAVKKNLNLSIDIIMKCFNLS